MRHVIIQRDLEEGSGYMASVPSLPGCHTQGDTEEEAIEMAKDAIRSWIEGALDNGLEVPPDDADARVVVVDELPLREPAADKTFNSERAA